MVSFHTGPALDEAIDAVLAQDVDLELIIVDNGNPEEVTAALKPGPRQGRRMKWAVEI